MAEEHEFKVGQFGKIGEHMVGFELSKRGWVIFYPPYDERTDIVAIKFRCKKCKAVWDNKHIIACLNQHCSEFEKEINSINSKKQYKNKRCVKCGYIENRTGGNAQISICRKCRGKLEEVALCPKCKKEIEIFGKNCSQYPECNSTEYELIFRSIQVKSSHLVDNGKNIGFNFKYQDLINSPSHFFIVYNRQIINNVERHLYWVLSVKDFLKIKNTNTVSFKIYQNDRGHYPLKDLAPYLFGEEEYYKLEVEKQKAYREHNRAAFKSLEALQKQVDVFRKLDSP